MGGGKTMRRVTNKRTKSAHQEKEEREKKDWFVFFYRTHVKIVRKVKQ